MTSAAQILRSKPHSTVYTIDAGATVYDAVCLMADKNVGALVVTERGKVVGIVSERDYARKIALMSRSSRDTLLRDIMSSPVMVVPPDRSAAECMALMTEHHIRHLPVMNGEQMLGLVSIGDLVKATIADQQFIIEQLEHYISGQRD